MRAPCAAMPLPRGRPVPSGRMLMSQALTSASATGWPRPGVSPASAAAAPASASATGKQNLSVHMLDLPVAVDRPAGDAVEVLIGEAEHRRRRLGLPAQRHELGAGRLHVAAFVPGAALQHHWLAVPAPRHAKAR